MVDFKKNNLHIVGYSEPVDLWMTLDELKQHLHSLPDQPDAIPYVTSYYSRNWGFCLTHEQLQSFVPGRYHVVIDAELKPGVLNYGELILPGELDQEIFLSTYICHPSMANNELSGPVVTTALYQWLKTLIDRKYTYRIVFITETIGSIVYLSKHLDYLIKSIISGFNITCMGDERAYSYLPSRNGKTLSDYVALHVLKHTDPDFIRYTWLDRGSDERQYCSPGVDLPLVTLCRSKYGRYPEYHTSLDNLDFVTPDGLLGGYGLVQDCISVVENNRVFRVTCYGEPQLGKRGLYSNLSTKKSYASEKTMMDFIAYADGNNDLLQISNIIRKPVREIVPIAEKLLEAGDIDWFVQ